MTSSVPHAVPSPRRAPWLLPLLLSACTAGSEGGPPGGAAVLEPHAFTEVVPARVRGGRIVDGHGRERLLRGVNARVEGLFDVSFDDGRAPLEEIPAFTADDAQRMAAGGFDLVRLPVNWSGLEPEEGAFDEAYLARLLEVLDACRAAGLYVLVDVHQDAYSKEIGEDGAPLWAIVPPPEERLGGPLGDDLSRRRLSRQVRAAFESFWDDRELVQTRFLPVWRLLITRLAGRPELIGLQPMNEPVYTGADESKLYAFYARAHAALRELDADTPLWVEPDALRNVVLAAPVPPSPFLDDNVVYAPHFYPQLVGVTADSVEGWREQLRPSLEAMAAEARDWGDAALVVGEWGADPRDPATAAYAEAVSSILDELRAGHALWLWKESSQGSWGLFDLDAAEGAETWVPREAGFRIFGPPRALAVPGRLLSHRVDVATGALTMRFAAEGDETAGPLLYLPPHAYPAGARATLDGAEVELVRDPASHRAQLRWPSGRAGTMELVVAPRDG